MESATIAPLALIIGLIVLFLQIIQLIRIGAAKKEIIAALDEKLQQRRNQSNSRDSRRRSRDSRDNRSSGNRGGSRGGSNNSRGNRRDSGRGPRNSGGSQSQNNNRESTSGTTEKSSEKSDEGQAKPASVDNSLRDINLRLKNAEKNQEKARREIKDFDNGQPKAAAPKKAPVTEAPKSEEKSPTADATSPKSESQSNIKSDDTGRVTLKRRSLEEGSDSSAGQNGSAAASSVSFGRR
jgi:hypothetical protein